MWILQPLTHWRTVHLFLSLRAHMLYLDCKSRSTLSGLLRLFCSSLSHKGF